MVDILHRVGVKAPPLDVYDALTTLKGLSGWWTSDTTGESGTVGGVIHFQFGERGFFDMKVVELQPEKRVRWEVIVGPSDWIGTQVIWELNDNVDSTIVRFKHQGWREPVEFMHHCSTKWGVFLMSLKAMLESGEANPWPKDVRVTVHAD